MAEVKFRYDLKKDAWSWVLIAKDKDVWGLDWKSQIAFVPDDLLDKILKSSFSKAQKLVETYLENHPKRKYREKIINSQIKALSAIWKSVEKKYFKSLEEIMQKPVCQDVFESYYTTGFMCPYEEKEGWFMVSMWHSVPWSITTICHEIMHLQFLHYFKRYLKKKGLTKNQIEDLKESLTFLLNEPEFAEIVVSSDDGYPEHQELRKELKKNWDKKQDFVKFLDKAIEITKNLSSKKK